MVAYKVSELRVRLMIKATNPVVINMYERIGFELSGTCTLEEALKVKSALENLPSEAQSAHDGEEADAIRQKLRSRVGLLMQQIVRI